MNTQITTALSDAELELVSGGCYKREESYDSDSDDYGCDEYESKGCEDSYSEDSDYGSCHNRRFRRFRRHHHSCSW